ncbi:phosphoribosylamine--glycine ligase [Actinopolymorpha singaporensis]|uniref:Phosphoribosylamine--glycine ligase n=1 Tax=Actinopolymorpha singaporensis TaxID=117157 RepID=A0A1H1LTA0_9ACTN|nr:phosphoribosylamine--glycine ligase [Actinopolymorpha singaporensis]SDR77844.1 phosphoribosylamine--glycine ligase [Actinopolymorpha singaporensis]
MDVLLVGSGGREHALALALSRDPDVSALHVAPGNVGMEPLAETHPLDLADNAAIAGLAARLGVDLVVIGPEAPLVAGAADAVRERGIACFGPFAAAARIEGSKAFAKEVMAAAGVPTAMAHVCEKPEQVAAALDAFGPPYVVKDDGLAAGKGVVVTNDRDAALAHAAACERVVVEEFLAGPEVSLFGICDGTTVVPLLPAQDFKRVGEGDSGPNTGGMGAYAPLDWTPPGFVDDVVARVLQPTVEELRRRGTPFVGVLYAGLALTARGVRVIEFNCRFGDPETQVVLALLESPLGRLLYAAATGGLAGAEPPRWRNGAAVTVVVSSAGYPESARHGDLIEGAEEAHHLEGVDVIHAGTARDADGRLVTAGGRVLAVTAYGSDLRLARDRAYDAVARISVEGAHHRSDIAARAALGEIVVPTS